MSFHEHCSGDGLLVLRQSQLYCHDGLSKCQHFVDTHIDVGQFQQSFQFLIYFQSYEAYADVCLDAAPCKVEHRSYLDIGFGYPEGPLHVPQVMIGCLHI